MPWHSSYKAVHVYLHGIRGTFGLNHNLNIEAVDCNLVLRTCVYNTSIIVRAKVPVYPLPSREYV